MVQYRSQLQNGVMSTFEALSVLEAGIQQSNYSLEPWPSLAFGKDALCIEADDPLDSVTAGLYCCTWKTETGYRACLPLDSRSHYDAALEWAKGKAPGLRVLNNVPIPRAGATKQNGLGGKPIDRDLPKPTPPKHLPDGYREEQAALLSTTEAALAAMQQHNSALEAAVTTAREQLRIVEDVYVADPTPVRGKTVIEARNDLALAELRARRLRQDPAELRKRAELARKNLADFDNGLYWHCAQRMSA